MSFQEALEQPSIKEAIKEIFEKLSAADSVTLSNRQKDYAETVVNADTRMKKFVVLNDERKKKISRISALRSELTKVEAEKSRIDMEMAILVGHAVTDEETEQTNFFESLEKEKDMKLKSLLDAMNKIKILQEKM